MMRSKDEEITRRMIKVCQQMSENVSGRLYICLLGPMDDWSEQGSTPRVVEWPKSNDAL